MLFNTFAFAGFFIVVFCLYLALRRHHQWQNRMLLAASYIFYGSWDWRFLSLILISTILDYVCGLKIAQSGQDRRKLFLFLSVFGNLSILGFFKYFNFFSGSLQVLFNYFGLALKPHFLNIILPVGISFYTFQTMSYTIDIYRGLIKPTRKFFDFALFVAFFPQLVAGPIERARHLLPQILNPRRLSLEGFYQGCYLIFWGLFMKVFVADNLAKIVDPVFSGSAPYQGSLVLIALYAFAFQIFCDFAGYSNIARGLGKCMGFEIMINFNLPYFATNPKDFWQRWHISLSTWLRDYLYIPLGGNRRGRLKTCRNLAITMLLGGLWHGAGWTFVLWGAYHGFLLIIYRVLSLALERMSAVKNLFAGKLWLYFKVILFFHLVCLGWLIFRAESLSQIFQMLHSLIFGFSWQAITGVEYLRIVFDLAFFTGLLLIVQIWQCRRNDLMAVLRLGTIPRSAFYILCYVLLILFGAEGGQEFIYFQF